MKMRMPSAERGKLRADARLDVRLAAQRPNAAEPPALVDQRDNDAEQDKEEEDAGIVAVG